MIQTLNAIRQFVSQNPVLYDMNKTNYDVIIGYYKVKPFDDPEGSGFYEVNNLFQIYLSFVQFKFIDQMLVDTKNIEIKNNTKISCETLKKHLQIKQSTSDQNIIICSDNIRLDPPNDDITYSNIFTDLEYNSIDDSLDHLFFRTYNYIDQHKNELFLNFKSFKIFNISLSKANIQFSVLKLLDYV